MTKATERVADSSLKTKIEHSFTGVWIPKEIYLSKDLNWTQKILFVEIQSLDNGEGCYASNEYLSEFLGVSKQTISDSISKLKKLGFIKQVSFDGKTRRLQVVDLNEIRRKDLPPKKKTSRGLEEKTYAHNMYNNIDNNINYALSSPKKGLDDEQNNDPDSGTIRAKPKTEMQKLACWWVKNFTHFYDTMDKKQTLQFFKRYGKCLSAIISACKTSEEAQRCIDLACDKMDEFGRRQGREIDWDLDYVARNIFVLYEEIKRNDYKKQERCRI